MPRTNPWAIQFLPYRYRLPFYEFESSTDSFGGRIFVILRIFGQEFEDNIFLPCDLDEGVTKCSSTVYNIEKLAV